MGMVKVTCWRGCAQPCSGGCVPPSCWQFPGSLPMCSSRDKMISLGDGAGCLPGGCLALGPIFQAVCRLLPWDASVLFSLANFVRRQGRNLLDLLSSISRWMPSLLSYWHLPCLKCVFYQFLVLQNVHILSVFVDQNCWVWLPLELRRSILWTGRCPQNVDMWQMAQNSFKILSNFQWAAFFFSLLWKNLMLKWTCF